MIWARHDHCNAYSGRQMPLHQISCPSSFFPPALYTEHQVRRSGISLWSVVVTCPGCVFSQSPRHPQLPHLLWQHKKQKRPLLCVESCSAITETAPSYQPWHLCSAQILNTAPYKSLWRKLAPTQPKPTHLDSLSLHSINHYTSSRKKIQYLCAVFSPLSLHLWVTT